MLNCFFHKRSFVFTIISAITLRFFGQKAIIHAVHFLAYYVYGSTTLAGPYNLIDSTNLITDTTLIHLAALGSSSTWYYYVVAIYDCSGFVPVPSATVNNSPPAVPIITAVTMIDGYAVLSWQPSPSPQTCFYIIYYDSIRGSSKRHLSALTGKLIMFL